MNAWDSPEFIMHKTRHNSIGNATLQYSAIGPNQRSIDLHSVRSVLTRDYMSRDTRGRHHIGDDSRQPRLRKQPVYIAHSSQSVSELEMDLGASVAHIYI